jgi:hypothetical protein
MRRAPWANAALYLMLAIRKDHGEPIATRLVDAMVIDDRDTSFVRTDRFDVRQRDRRRAQFYAVTLRIPRCV